MYNLFCRLMIITGLITLVTSVLFWYISIFWFYINGIIIWRYQVFVSRLSYHGILFNTGRTCFRCSTNQIESIWSGEQALEAGPVCSYGISHNLFLMITIDLLKRSVIPKYGWWLCSPELRMFFKNYRKMDWFRWSIAIQKHRQFSAWVYGSLFRRFVLNPWLK